MSDSNQIEIDLQSKGKYLMADAISTANLIAVPAKVDPMNGLEQSTSALVEDTLAVNQLGDECLCHSSAFESSDDSDSAIDWPDKQAKNGWGGSNQLCQVKRPTPHL